MKIKALDKFRQKKECNGGTIGVVTLINILLAILALLKDILLASYMGTSSKADALLLAYFITDMIGNNLIANAIGTSFIPIFSRVHIREIKNKQLKFTLAVNMCFFLLVSIVTIIIFIFRVKIIDLLGVGFTSDTKLLCIQLLVIILPSMLLYPLVSIGIAASQVFSKFVVSSLAPVLFNFSFLVGTAYCYLFNIPQQQGVYIIAFSILISVLIMAILVYRALIKEFNLKITDMDSSSIIEKQLKINNLSLMLSNKDRTYIADVFKLFIPYFLIVFFSQDMLYFERYLASKFNEGSVAALNYAYRLAQFPIWIFVSAIGTVIFPLMSKLKEKGNINELRATLEKTIGITVIIIVPLTIIIYILRVPIIETLFQRCTFDKESVELTAEILKGYSLSILGQSITVLCIKFFLSKGEMKLPITIMLISGILNICADFYFINKVGIAALGYGAAIGSLLSTISLLYLIKLPVKSYLNKKTLELAKLFGANIIILMLSILFNKVWNGYIVDKSFLYKFSYISCGFLISSILYFIILKKVK